MPLTTNELTAAKFHYEAILLAENDEDRAPHWEALGTMIRKDTVEPLRELGLVVVIEILNQNREKQGLARKEYAIVTRGEKNANSSK